MKAENNSQQHRSQVTGSYTCILFYFVTRRANNNRMGNNSLVEERSPVSRGFKYIFVQQGVRCRRFWQCALTPGPTHGSCNVLC